MDTFDVWTRVIGAAVAFGSITFAAITVRMNWLKHRRELAAAQPQISLIADRINVRKWRIRLIVSNPGPGLLAWVKVKAIKPLGLQVISADREAMNARNGDRPMWDYEDFFFVENYPVLIKPGKSAEWIGYARVADEFGVSGEERPIVEPVFDETISQRGGAGRVAK